MKLVIANDQVRLSSHKWAPVVGSHERLLEAVDWAYYSGMSPEFRQKHFEEGIVGSERVVWISKSGFQYLIMCGLRDRAGNEHPHAGPLLESMMEQFNAMTQTAAVRGSAKCQTALRRLDQLIGLDR